MSVSEAKAKPERYPDGSSPKPKPSLGRSLVGRIKNVPTGLWCEYHDKSVDLLSTCDDYLASKDRVHCRSFSTGSRGRPILKVTICTYTCTSCAHSINAKDLNR